MKKILIICVCLMLTVCAFATNDTLSTEQIKDLSKLSEYSKTWNIALNVWALLGPILAALVTWFGLKTRMEKWAEDSITIKASEKFGVDWSIVNKLVVERKTLLEKRGQCKIAVISSSEVKNEEIEILLNDAGFRDIIWYPISKMITFDQNKSNFILIDNSNGGLVDDKTAEIVNTYKEGYKFIWFTASDSNYFNSFARDKVSFVKKKSNIVDSIDTLRA